MKKFDDRVKAIQDEYEEVCKLFAEDSKGKEKQKQKMNFLLSQSFFHF